MERRREGGGRQGEQAASGAPARNPRVDRGTEESDRVTGGRGLPAVGAWPVGREGKEKAVHGIRVDGAARPSVQDERRRPWVPSRSRTVCLDEESGCGIWGVSAFSREMEPTGYTCRGDWGRGGLQHLAHAVVGLARLKSAGQTCRLETQAELMLPLAAHGRRQENPPQGVRLLTPSTDWMWPTHVMGASQSPLTWRLISPTNTFTWHSDDV